jgi:hypothetical protein
MSQAQRDSLLAQPSYDNEADSARSASDQASDSEDERVAEKSRTTLELNEFDASVLRDEEERQNLLTKKGPFDGIKNAFRVSSSNLPLRQDDRKARRQRRKEQRASERGLKGESAEEGQLLFEMEEGFKDISSRSTSSDSLRLDQQSWIKQEKQVSFPAVIRSGT